MPPRPRSSAELPHTEMSNAVTPEEQKKSNLRMALILASIAAVFFMGFIVKMAFFGH